MWRFLTPAFANRYKTILFDLVGSGESDLSAYDRDKYGTLEGHAADVMEIIDEHANGPVIFVGHSVNLRFPGQLYDQEDNLFYNYFRNYDPTLGRYVQSDPIGLNGGTNTYAYVGGNPVRYVDPLGFDFGVAGGGTITLFNDNGHVLGSWPYSSGMNGNTDPSQADQGPIPPGQYSLDPSEISQAGFFRDKIDPRDWGDFRVPLHPDQWTNVYGRAGFFLHGGRLRHGSEGCIKAEGPDQDTLFGFLMREPGPIPIYVAP
jgi:RHS repeat-associated protein